MFKITLLSLATLLSLTLPVGATTRSNVAVNDINTQSGLVVAQRVRQRQRCRVVRQQVCRYNRYHKRTCRYVMKRVCRNVGRR